MQPSLPKRGLVSSKTNKVNGAVSRQPVFSIGIGSIRLRQKAA